MRIRFEADTSREIVQLAYPIILGSIAQVLLSTVDTIMLGRLSSTALAAAGMGATVYLTVVMGFGALCLGVQTLVARRYGERQHAQCGRVLNSALVFAIAFGAVFALVSPWLSRILARAMQSDPVMGAQLADYLRWRFVGTAFVLLNSSYRGFFSGVGRTKIRMGAAILLTGANLVLDYLLIFGHAGFPALGVKGAAIASTLATLLGTFYFASFSGVRATRQQYRLYVPANVDFAAIRRLATVSLPLMIRTLAGSGGFVVFLWIIGRIGTVELGASNVLRSLNSISYMIGAALGAAATTAVGHRLGAGSPDRAETAAWTAVAWGVLFMGLLGIGFVAFPKAFLRIYVDDPTVIHTGATALRILGFAQLVNAIGAVLGPALIGAGDLRFVMGIEIVATYALFLPLAWLLGVHLHLGVVGAWTAELLYVAATALGTALRIRKGAWKAIRI